MNRPLEKPQGLFGSDDWFWNPYSPTASQHDVNIHVPKRIERLFLLFFLKLVKVKKKKKEKKKGLGGEMKNSTDDRLYSSRVLSMDKEAGGGGGRS